MKNIIFCYTEIIIYKIYTIHKQSALFEEAKKIKNCTNILLIVEVTSRSVAGFSRTQHTKTICIEKCFVK